MSKSNYYRRRSKDSQRSRSNSPTAIPPVSVESEADSAAPLSVTASRVSAVSGVSRNLTATSETKSILSRIASSYVKHRVLVLSMSYRMMDTCFSCFLVLPIVLFFVHGTWKLYDAATFEKEYWGKTESLLVGFGVPFIFYFFQKPFHDMINTKSMSCFSFYVITRLLLVGHCFTFSLQWKGVWDSLDSLFPPQESSNCLVTPWKGTPLANNVASIATFFAGSLIAFGLRVFTNVLASPICLGVDDPASIFACPLRYGTPYTSPFKHILDCLFSVVVVETLVIAIWRGGWYTIEYYFIPFDRWTSTLAGGGIGFGLTFLLSIVHPTYFDMMIKLEGHERISALAVINFVAFIACVFSWRVIWDLLEIMDGQLIENGTIKFNKDDMGEIIPGHAGPSLLFPEKYQNHIFTTLLSLLLAVPFGCLSTIVVRGAVVDGELSSTVHDDWQLSYVTLLQRRDHSLPFPEPWILRFCCTNQRLLPDVASEEDLYYNSLKINEVPPQPETTQQRRASAAARNRARAQQNMTGSELQLSNSSEPDLTADESYVLNNESSVFTRHVIASTISLPPQHMSTTKREAAHPPATQREDTLVPQDNTQAPVS